MTDGEYIVYVNMREGSMLWELLADDSQSDDEGVRNELIPRYAKILSDWHLRGYVKFMRGTEWDTPENGQEVPGGDVVSVLSSPNSWQYRPEGEERICLTWGPVPVNEHLSPS